MRMLWSYFVSFLSSWYGFRLKDAWGHTRVKQQNERMTRLILYPWQHVQGQKGCLIWILGIAKKEVRIHIFWGDFPLTLEERKWKDSTHQIVLQYETTNIKICKISRLLAAVRMANWPLAMHAMSYWQQYEYREVNHEWFLIGSFPLQEDHSSLGFLIIITPVPVFFFSLIATDLPATNDHLVYLLTLSSRICHSN